MLDYSKEIKVFRWGINTPLTEILGSPIRLGWVLKPFFSSDMYDYQICIGPDFNRFFLEFVLLCHNRRKQRRKNERKSKVGVVVFLAALIK